MPLDLFEVLTPFTMYCCNPKSSVNAETTKEVSPYLTVLITMPFVVWMTAMLAYEKYFGCHLLLVVLVCGINQVYTAVDPFALVVSAIPNGLPTQRPRLVHQAHTAIGRHLVWVGHQPRIHRAICRQPTASLTRRWHHRLHRCRCSTSCNCVAQQRHC